MDVVAALLSGYHYAFVPLELALDPPMPRQVVHHSSLARQERRFSRERRAGFIAHKISLILREQGGARGAHRSRHAVLSERWVVPGLPIEENAGANGPFGPHD